MPYSNRTETRVRSTTMQTTTLSGPVAPVITQTPQTAKIENRSGNNHSYAGRYLKDGIVGFTADGLVRFKVGVQKIPTRRHRWVKGANGYYREFYITTRDRVITVDVPVASISYRKKTPLSISKNKLQGLLKPNALSYYAEESSDGGFKTLNTRNKEFTAYATGHSFGVPLGPMLPSASFTPFASLGQFAPKTTWTSAEKTSVRNKALTGLYNKVANDFPNFGIMIGEGKETLNTMQQLLLKGIRLVKALKKLDTRRLKKELEIDPKSLSSAWLTFIYGVAPVIGDIDDINTLISRQAADYRTYTRAPFATKNETYVVGSLTSTFQSILNIVTRYTHKFGVIMDGELSLFQALGKGNLLNPASVAYDIIPFSFMVDWLYDLGSFLANQSALRYGFVYGWETTVTEFDYYETRIYRYNPNDETTMMSPVSIFAHKHTIAVDRIPRNANTFPQMPIPKFTPYESVTNMRALNALAIFVNINDAFRK